MTRRVLPLRARWLCAVVLLAVLFASACAAQGSSSAPPPASGSASSTAMPSVATTGTSDRPTSSTTSGGPGSNKTAAPARSMMLSNSARLSLDQLTGTEWLLTSITTSGKTTPVPAVMDATLALDGAGHVTMQDGCNDSAGPVSVSPSRLEIAPMSMSGAACTGYTQIRAAYPYELIGAVDWTVENGTLVLTSPTGTRFTFVVRPSIYPSDRAGGDKVKVLDQGTRGAANYRFYYQPSKIGVGLGVEYRSSPGADWGDAGQYRQFTDELYPADPGDASGVPIGGADFLFVISDDKTARITVTPTGGTAIDVHHYARDDTGHFTIFGSFVGNQRHTAIITLYDKDGTVIGEPYPWRW